MMCERNAEEMSADKWLTWAGQGYVQRTVALRLKGKQTVKIQDQNTYHYKRIHRTYGNQSILLNTPSD